MYRNVWLPLWPIGVLALIGGVIVSFIGSPLYEPVKGLSALLLSLVAVVVSARAGWRPHTARQLVRPWRLMTLYWVFSSATQGLFLAAFSGGPGKPPKADLLLVGAALWLVQTVPMLAALLVYPTRSLSRAEWVRFGLDMVTIGGAGFVALWHLVLAPAQTASLGAPRTITIVQPVLHLIVIFAACAVMLRGRIMTFRHPLAFLLCGNIGIAASVISIGYVLSHNHVAVNLPVIDLLSTTSTTLIIIAAVMFRRGVGGDALTGTSTTPRRPTILPYLAMALGYSTLLAASFTEGSSPWIGLVSGALVMTGAVAGRQIIALRENHNFVVRDPLTGLSSRVALYDELDHAADNPRPAAVLMIDLNGFKPVNDTLGHQAGDELLVEFARLLRRCVRPSDTVARLGGDEFAIVMLDVPSSARALEVAESIVRACTSPLPAAGRMVTVGASIGVSLHDPGEPNTGQELLRRADIAMYQIKHLRGDRHVALYDPGMESRQAPHLVPAT